MLTDKYSQQKDHKIFWKNLRSGDGSNDIIFFATQVLRVPIFNHHHEALTLYAMMIATICIYLSLL